jgi:hypothetical protein
MASKRTVTVTVGAALLAVAGIAVAAGQYSERDEASETKIALAQVPAAAMEGAKTQLMSITKAELVKMKDGRTIYELKGKHKAGKTVELYVSAEGQVLGTEGEEREHKG